MDVAILGGMYAASAVAYQMVAYTVGTMFIIGVCLYKGAVMEWNRIDTACMVIVLVAIGLWYRTGDPNMAIMFSLVAIVVGTVPLLLKLRTNPEVEPLAPWILIIIGSVFGLIAIPAITIADAATPIVFFLIQATVLYLMLRSSRSAEVSKV